METPADKLDLSNSTVLEELCKRKKIVLNGKDFPLPRKIAERIYFKRETDIRSSKVPLQSSGTGFKYVSKTRYKSSDLSRQMSRFLQRRASEDFASKLPDFGCGSHDEMDYNALHEVSTSESSNLVDRENFQSNRNKSERKKAKI